MKSKLFIALSAFTVVFALTLSLRSQSDQPVLRVGHGVTAPRWVNDPDPEYSEEARKAGLQGRCVLSLVVNSEGKPENVNVSRSLGMGLDEKAVEAVRTWTFDPGRKEGKPVAVQISVVVTFRIRKGRNGPMLSHEALERAAEDRRRVQSRVYRIEDVTAPPLCRSPQEEKQPTSISIPGIKGDAQGYRLHEITFTDNKTLTNAAALRSLFPIQDGEPFEPRKVADGLRSLAKAYRIQGFVSFKSSVEPRIDDSQRSIALQIECNEGRQFYADRINIEELDEHTFQEIRKSLYLRPGDLYNENLASLWLEKNSRLTTPDRSLSERIKLDVDENVGTVVMTYDFTRCAE